MNTKYCAYSGCNNFILNGKSSGLFNFFEFPKNEILQNKWVTNGKVTDYDPNRVYFMCSDHFHKKNISVNNHRVSLVDKAVPNSCNSIDIKMDGGKTNSMEKTFTEEDNCSVKKKDGKEKITELRKETGKNKDVGILNACKPKNRNSLISDILELELVSKAASNGGMQVFNISGISPGTDALDIEPNESVKTFMFKGTEYVEMSRSYYLQEKANLLEELELYKTFVSKVKSEYTDFKSNLTN